MPFSFAATIRLLSGPGTGIRLRRGASRRAANRMVAPALVGDHEEGLVMVALGNLALLVGRVFIAAIFIYDATLLARFPGDNVAYLESFGVPSLMLWPTALFQFVGGLMIVVGLETRLTALGFAVFCVMTAL